MVSTDKMLLQNMHTLCQINLVLIILLINLFLSEGADTIIDIDDDDLDIVTYKKRKQTRPFILQNKTERIVGGNKTTIEKYPFIVSLQEIGFLHICGGSIINVLWVLTASHCISECDADPCVSESLKIPSEYKIVVGASNAMPMEWGQIREIEKFVGHPNFRRPLLQNDIGLIMVKIPFEFSKFVQEIPIPRLSALEGRDVSNRYKECLALGWGAQKPRSGKKLEDLSEQERKDIETDLVAPILMVVCLPVIPTKLCKYLIGDKYITNRHLCTMYAQGGRDACEGDSGGPLVCDNMLYGITSWAHGCARQNTPAVFTRVDTYDAWIQNIMMGGPNIDYYRSSGKFVVLNWKLLFNIYSSLLFLNI